ncbi:MAG: leucine-rich repeat domain-containing protein, partial [Bacteroidota bacterium]
MKYYKGKIPSQAFLEAQAFLNTTVIDPQKASAKLFEVISRSYEDSKEAERASSLIQVVKTRIEIAKARASRKGSMDPLLAVDYFFRGTKHFKEGARDKALELFQKFESSIVSQDSGLPGFKAKIPLEVWTEFKGDREVVGILVRERIREVERTRNTILNLGNCGLTEIPLEVCNMIWLEELILSDDWINDQQVKLSNQISEIPLNINQLSSLKKLVLSGTKSNPWMIDDLSPLSDLRNLSELHLDYNQIKNLSPLRDLKSLKRLSVGHNPIESSQESLDLSGTRISGLHALQGLENLQSLDLRYTRIIDTTPLQGLANLQSLYLSGTEVTDTTPLQGLSNLQSLYLSGTEVTDITPLQGLEKLQILYINGTQITDITPLQGLANLQVLDLSNLLINDLPPLVGLSNLQSLYLRSTQLTPLSTLSGLEKLQSFDLNGNQNREISEWLIGLPRLKKLDLRGCHIPYIPYEILQLDNCYGDLKNWFHDLKQGAVLNE